MIHSKSSSKSRHQFNTGVEKRADKLAGLTSSTSVPTIKAWFPYDRWRSFTIAGIASKLFSDRNDHMETKFSFCQRPPTIPATTNDRNDHDRWDFRVYTLRS